MNEDIVLDLDEDVINLRERKMSVLLGEYIFHVERTKNASVGVELRLTSKR